MVTVHLFCEGKLKGLGDLSLRVNLRKCFKPCSSAENVQCAKNMAEFFFHVMNIDFLLLVLSVAHSLSYQSI